MGNQDRIIEQLKRMRPRSLDDMRSVVSIIFAKAAAEPHLCGVYGYMVRELASAYPEIESLGASDEIGGFQHLLASTCQSKLDHVAAGRHPVTITLLNGERVVVDLNACD